MKNLEDVNVLSDKVLYAIDLILAKTPTVVFGGSIALNAVGLINRKISDIDLFFGLGENLNLNGFLSVATETGITTSDTVTNVNGLMIQRVQRVGALIGGVRVCCFKVPYEELDHSKHSFVRNNKLYTLYIQNVNYAIEAKRSYANQNTKHSADLVAISTSLDDLPF